MERRTLAAAATPLKDGGAALDESVFEPLVAFLQAGGLDGLLSLGTTGEGILLSAPERKRVSELFVEVAPADLNLDDSGFADFQRVYVPGTVVTLTAPVTRDGLAFSGWEIDGTPAPSVSGSTSVTLVENATTAEAVYVPVSRVPGPPPPPAPVPRPAPRPVSR